MLALVAASGAVAAGVHLSRLEPRAVATDPVERPETLGASPGAAAQRSRASTAGPGRAASARAVRPARLAVPGVAVDAPVVPITMETSTLVPPDDPQVLGWWADGAKPGAAWGTALVTGHTVHAGGGALDDLEDVRRGDQVIVEGPAGAVRLRVTRVEVLSKDQLAERATRLFSQEVRGRLAIVTCENWNGTTYDANVVVIARPSGGGGS